MAARGGKNNIVSKRVIDDLIDISGERSPPKYLKIFIEQQITDHRRFIARMHDEIRTSTNLISQRDKQDKVADFNRLIVVAEEKIHGKEIDLEMLEAEGNDGFDHPTTWLLVRNKSDLEDKHTPADYSGYEVVSNICSELIDGMAFALVCESPMCLIRIAVGNTVSGFWQVYSEVLIMEIQAIDDQDHLVNYDNDNENDDLGYRSEEYFDEADEEDGNNHSNGNVVKRGITRISGKHRALFLSFLGDMVHEHIGLKILSWKKVDSEARYKLWDEITSESWVNKDEEYPDDEIRSVGDKLKKTEDKIKEGTLKVDHDTDAMTVVLGKEKGGYA
ncbi:hypothetical protein Tco_0689589 [Tanacetum coccineum]